MRIAAVGGSDDDKADALTAAEMARARAAGVSLLGSRDDVVRLYGGMDPYCLASHREGYPRSAMEAAATGLPVIATDIRGCREVVGHGVNGLLIPPRDPRRLTDAIASLATDEHERRWMGAAGRDRALREFDQRRCIDITLDTHDRLLGARRLPRVAHRP